jgi:Family of unknown function (DUF6488)
MKNLVSVAILATILCATSAVFAGGDGACHFHGNAPAKEAAVTGCVTAHKDALAANGKIEASWKSVKLESAETVDGKKMKEWKLTFKNPSAKDAAKQTLYMFYSLSGNLIGANFTGQ